MTCLRRKFCIYTAGEAPFLMFPVVRTAIGGKIKCIIYALNGISFVLCFVEFVHLWHFRERTRLYLPFTTLRHTHETHSFFASDLAYRLWVDYRSIELVRCFNIHIVFASNTSGVHQASSFACGLSRRRVSLLFFVLLALRWALNIFHWLFIIWWVNLLLELSTQSVPFKASIFAKLEFDFFFGCVSSTFFCSGSGLCHLRLIQSLGLPQFLLLPLG